MKRAAGFSMVELMVAMTLALMVTGAIISVFIGSRSAYQSTSGTAALTDGGRQAMDFISQTVRNAGFMGCATAARVMTPTNLTPGPSPIYYGFNFTLGGFEAGATKPGNLVVLPARPALADNNLGDWLLGMDPSMIAPTNASPPVKGSDVLLANGALPNSQPAFVTNITAGSVNFQVNAVGNLAAGQTAVISDCLAAVAFQITGAGGITITHSGGQNSSNTFPASAPGVGAVVMAVTTRLYYIGVGVDGDGALFAYDTNGTTNFTPMELVDDIENMQVLYGIDSTPNPTQTVVDYVTADQVPDWGHVVSVKVALLAASPAGAVPAPAVAPLFNLLGTQVQAPIDTRARRVFTMDITVRNDVVTGS